MGGLLFQKGRPLFLKQADKLLGPHFGVSFLEHGVEVVQFPFAEYKVYRTAGSRQDDGAGIGIMYGLVVFLFIGDNPDKGLEVVGVEREHCRSETYLEVLTIFAFNDITVLSGVAIFEMAHAVSNFMAI
jgi:hypothetical protein